MYLSVAYVKQIEQAFQQAAGAALDVTQASITRLKIEYGYFLARNPVRQWKVAVRYDVTLFTMDNRISTGAELRFTRRFTCCRPALLLPRRLQCVSRGGAVLRDTRNDEIVLRIPESPQVFSADEYAQYVRIRQQAASVLLAAGS